MEERGRLVETEGGHEQFFGQILSPRDDFGGFVSSPSKDVDWNLFAALTSFVASGGTSDLFATVSGQVNVTADKGVVPSSVSGIREIDWVVSSATSSLESSNVTTLDSGSWSVEEIGAVAAVSVMVPFILISNIFVILSITRFRRLHTPTNYFITSLAAVDIFVALATPFGIVVEVFQFGGAAQPQDVLLCLLPNRVLMMACGVSVLTLAAIAYDRHTALVSPLTSVRIMSPRKVAIMVTLTWIYSLMIVWFPVMMGWYNLPSDDAPCSANLIHGKAPVLFLGAIFLPSCAAILVCYFRIFKVARRHVKTIAALELAVHQHRKVKFMVKDTRYAKTLGLVIGAFLVLWLPYLICIFAKTVGSINMGAWVQTYLILVAVFNSGINPWIYAYKNTELRAAFRRLFTELCGNTSSKFPSRRSSLESASSMPRLSLSDSRSITVISEAALENPDKLTKSPVLLDKPAIKHDFCRNKDVLSPRSRPTNVWDNSAEPLFFSLQLPQKETSRYNSNFGSLKNETFNNKHSRCASLNTVYKRENKIPKSRNSPAGYKMGHQCHSYGNGPPDIDCSHTSDKSDIQRIAASSSPIISRAPSPMVRHVTPFHPLTLHDPSASKPSAITHLPLRATSTCPLSTSAHRPLGGPTLSVQHQNRSTRTTIPYMTVPHITVPHTTNPHTTPSSQHFTLPHLTFPRVSSRPSLQTYTQTLSMLQTHLCYHTYTNCLNNKYTLSKTRYLEGTFPK